MYFEKLLSALRERFASVQQRYVTDPLGFLELLYSLDACEDDALRELTHGFRESREHGLIELTQSSVDDGTGRTR